MVDVQLARRGIRDRRVLNAMKQVPRERFVEPGLEEFAYEDGALPIANEQTISQPYIVALMTEAAELKPPDKVLEVGTGSGYAAAVASQLAKTVHTIERHEDLARIAARRLAALGYDKLHRPYRRWYPRLARSGAIRRDPGRRRRSHRAGCTQAAIVHRRAPRHSGW